MPLYVSFPLWVLVSGLGLGVCLLPRRVELALGRALGRAALALGLFKRRIASDNIAMCLPELGEAERAGLLARNYEHYGILFFEYLHMLSPLPGHYRRYSLRNSLLENRELWDRARANGRPVIIFCAHLGFWEMAAAAAGLAGYEPTIVTTVMKPRWLHDRITDRRASLGVSAAFHPGSMPTILRALRRGGSVAFMNDQYAHPPMGRPVVFFGRRVDTLGVVGPLAERTGAAVLPVYATRREDGVTRVIVEPELDLTGCSGEEATQRIAARVEEWVRRQPEQWLWMHRRFKNSVPA